MKMFQRVDFDIFKGETIVKIEKDEDSTSIYFYCKNGMVIQMTHLQDCCESVYLEEIEGDLNSILNSKILFAEESIEKKDEETLSFYKIATEKACITLRWYGESNGYYSEEVDLMCLKAPIWEEVDWSNIEKAVVYSTLIKREERSF